MPTDHSAFFNQRPLTDSERDERNLREQLRRKWTVLNRDAHELVLLSETRPIGTSLSFSIESAVTACDKLEDEIRFGPVDELGAVAEALDFKVPHRIAGRLRALREVSLATFLRLCLDAQYGPTDESRCGGCRRNVTR